MHSYQVLGIWRVLQIDPGKIFKSTRKRGKHTFVQARRGTQLKQDVFPCTALKDPGPVTQRIAKPQDDAGSDVVTEIKCQPMIDCISAVGFLEEQDIR